MMHRTASAVVFLHAGKNKKMKISRLMSVFKNIFPKVYETGSERAKRSRKEGETNFHKYMKEKLGALCCSAESNHRLLTFILKDEAPLESSW